MHLMDQMGSGAGAGGIIIGVLVRPNVTGAVGVGIVVLRFKFRGTFDRNGQKPTSGWPTTA